MNALIPSNKMGWSCRFECTAGGPLSAVGVVVFFRSEETIVDVLLVTNALLFGSMDIWTLWLLCLLTVVWIILTMVDCVVGTCMMMDCALRVCVATIVVLSIRRGMRARSMALPLSVDLFLELPMTIGLAWALITDRSP